MVDTVDGGVDVVVDTAVVPAIDVVDEDVVIVGNVQLFIGL